MVAATRGGIPVGVTEGTRMHALRTATRFGTSFSVKVEGPTGGRLVQAVGREPDLV